MKRPSTSYILRGILGLVATYLSTSPVNAGPLVDLQEEWRIQFHAIADEMKSGTAKDADNRPYDQEALYSQNDRHPVDVVIRRTEAMLNHLEGQSGFELDVPACRAELAELKILADTLPNTGRVTDLDFGNVGRNDRHNPEKVPNKAGTLGLGEHETAFIRACELNRRIALANPLVKDVQRLVFVKKHPPRVGHMCDQWFGMVQSVGGGLYVLDQPGREGASVHNLVAGKKVQSGARAGQELVPGSFATPEVTYDGETIWFAYSGVEESFADLWEEAYSTYETKKEELGAKAARPYATGPAGGRNTVYSEENYLRTKEDAFNLFKIQADGTGLTQVTSGAEEDFSPCVLPNGRIVFVSTRRGGEGRCHPRPDPTYVLHSMLPDGSDLQPMSYHEINEWSPHVNNDGDIVYSRWDYMDRKFFDGQQTWIIKQDGRDSRELFGNYESIFRGKVMADFRAIRNTPLYVGVQHSHHSSVYGPLMVYDSRKPEIESQPGLRYLTPYGKLGEYASPYPLDENFFLCVWSPDSPDLSLNTFRWFNPPTPHGVYLLDRWGNRTLLYRDQEIAAMGPMPLQPRVAPPVQPHNLATAAPPGQQNNGRDPEKSVFAVMDVYNSRMPWPEGRDIKELRVIQIFPKTTPRKNNPSISYNGEINARGILGNVPVEKDGSAHFEVPAGVPIYLQALDQNGLAIQSMRTSFYGLPGEVNTCVGCHEPKNEAPKVSGGMPTALARAPSVPSNAPAHSFPINFAVMIQPILEKNCVECHQKDASGKAPSFANSKTSHRQLREWAFCVNDRGDIMTMPKGEMIPTSPVRTIPGKTGAVMSRLYPLLTEGTHKDLHKLSPEDMASITAWLDTMSVRFGAYENWPAQEEGKLVMPSLY